MIHTFYQLKRNDRLQIVMLHILYNSVCLCVGEHSCVQAQGKSQLLSLRCLLPSKIQSLTVLDLAKWEELVGKCLRNSPVSASPVLGLQVCYQHGFLKCGLGCVCQTYFGLPTEPFPSPICKLNIHKIYGM